MPQVTKPVTQESKPRDIWIFLAIAFATSWVLWWLGIKLKVREELLIFGVAGPAFAAASMRLLRPSAASPKIRFSLPLFIVLVPVCWIALVLSISSAVSFKTLQWDPILLLPALVPALATAFFRGAGEIRWPGWRWPLLAVLAWPAFLLIPAWGAQLARLPVVQPRHGESALVTAAAAAVLFLRQLLFAAFLEEPGWRGCLLPRLQNRHSALVASLLVWLPWAAWHAPLDFTGSVGHTWLNYLEIRVIFFIPITILLTWLYNRSQGSILAVSLFHAAFNTFPFVLPYSPPFLALIFVFAAWAVIADRMWHPADSTLSGNSCPPPEPS
jgi:membrane protease YdiL (CAAX protease family)